jgi:hypothetical protein
MKRTPMDKEKALHKSCTGFGNRDGVDGAL